MTRDEMIQCLEAVSNAGIVGKYHDALRAAIALLQPPTTAEIEAAREAIRGLRTHMLGDCDRECATLDRALDALAREPGLEKSIEDSTAWIGKVLAERDTLEARLARVRELIDHPRLGGVRDEHTVTVGQVRAALAADAGPVKP